MARWFGPVVGTVVIAAAVGARALVAAPSWTWVLQNLALAWIPVLLGLAATRSRTLLLALLPAWWAFLPNAPYLLTDLVHLRSRAAVPHWFDVCLLGGLGALGLALGARSLGDVAAAADRHLGWTAGLALRILVPPSCGLAMVLGRELRFHSWHLVTRPLEVLDGARDVLFRGGRLDGLAMAVVFGAAVAAAAAWATPPAPAERAPSAG